MPDASGNGYWLVTATGNVYAFGDAVDYGQPGPQSVPVTAAARTADGGGYWLLFPTEWSRLSVMRRISVIRPAALALEPGDRHLHNVVRRRLLDRFGQRRHRRLRRRPNDGLWPPII